MSRRIALGKERYVGEIIPVMQDVVQVGVGFPPHVRQRPLLQSCYGNRAFIVNDRRQFLGPLEGFLVPSDDDLKTMWHEIHRPCQASNRLARVIALAIAWSMS
jgi:hypothetical protein